MGIQARGPAMALFIPGLDPGSPNSIAQPDGDAGSKSGNELSQWWASSGAGNEIHVGNPNEILHFVQDDVRGL